jgi:uncharacterized protein (TIGR02147 family)
VLQQPQKGRGCYAKMAEDLGLSAVMVSQIFNGEKNLSMEHAILLAEFLSLNAKETEYFLLLVQYEKAGSHKLQQYYKKEIQALQQHKKDNLNEVVKKDIQMSDTEKAIFYSNWLYSAVRLLTSIKGFQSIDSLTKYLQVPKDQIQNIMQFLLDKGLCVQSNKGYQMGPQRTHLEAQSPYIKSRQVSWRVKGFEKMDLHKKNHLFYTAPMSISEKQYDILRKKITDLIADFINNMPDEDPEKLACLNIDLFEL